MAVAVRFCGRCGGPLTPGTAFCGRCGAPQDPAMWQGAYTYPLAQPGAIARPRGLRLGQVAVAVGLLVILSITTVVVSAIAVSRVIAPPHQACTANCGAKIVVPLPESSTFRSSTYKFEVDYNSEWTVNTQDASAISLATKAGELHVTGTKAVRPDDQLIQVTVGALPSATWQSVALVSHLKGAHIGDQDGQGAIYSANLVGSNATAKKVRFVVVAATKGGVSVVLFGVNPEDTKNYPSGIQEGSEFDYLCREFRWAGEG